MLKQKANLVKSEKGLTVTDDSSTARRGERRAPLTRPSVVDDCTESDWSFFKASWGRYVTACRLEETEVTAHLWSACSESLQKALHNQGATSSTSEAELLDGIRQLAVKKANNLVAVVAFQEMKPQRVEPPYTRESSPCRKEGTSGNS